MQNIALAHSTDIVDYAPASTMVMGKTVSERRLSVLPNASFEAKLFMASRAGKVGKYAREALSHDVIKLIATKARQGNYRPLSETLAGMLGESVTISNRASYDALADRFSDRLADLSLAKNGGYTIDKKTGTSKPNSKRKVFSEVISFIKSIQELASSVE
jgi:hypothetical protein